MSIRFSCACGTLLHACEPEGQRRATCPVCGLPADALFRAASPLDRPREIIPRASRGGEDGYTLEPLPLDVDLPAPPRKPLPAYADEEPPGPRGQPLPHGCLRRLFWLSLGLTLLSAGPLLWLRDEEAPAPWLLLFCGAGGLVVLGYTWGLFQCVLSSAAGSVGAQRYWPGSDVLRLLRSVRDGLVSFLAGPVVFAVVGVYFWQEAGDLATVDRFLLAELALATAGGWLLGFTAATVRGRLRDALPPGVVKLAWRLGWRGAAVTLLGSAGILVFGRAGVEAVEVVQSQGHPSVALFFCWLCLLGWTMAVLYWLGRCWAHARSLAKPAGRRQVGPARASPHGGPSIA